MGVRYSVRNRVNGAEVEYSGVAGTVNEAIDAVFALIEGRKVGVEGPVGKVEGDRYVALRLPCYGFPAGTTGRVERWASGGISVEFPGDDGQLYYLEPWVFREVVFRPPKNGDEVMFVRMPGLSEPHSRLKTGDIGRVVDASNLAGIWVQFPHLRYDDLLYKGEYVVLK